MFTPSGEFEAPRHHLIALDADAGLAVNGTERAALQITELVEHEQRMIAGAFAMAVPDAHLLFAIG